MNPDLRNLSRPLAIRDFLLGHGVNVRMPEGESGKLVNEGETKGKILEVLGGYFFGCTRMNHGQTGFDFTDFSSTGGYVTLIFEEGDGRTKISISWTDWRPS